MTSPAGGFWRVFYIIISRLRSITLISVRLTLRDLKCFGFLVTFHYYYFVLFNPLLAKAVFMAEQIMAAGSSWHKACFTCKFCNKRLDSHTLRERESDVYCHRKIIKLISLIHPILIPFCSIACYGKNFGPKGYWGWSSQKVA